MKSQTNSPTIYYKIPPVTVTGTILKETSAALLLLVEEKEFWLPLSQIHEIHRSTEGDTIKLEHWIAEKRGLI